MSDRFHDLRVAEVRRETADCVSIVLDVPADLTEAFAFKQGQYLTFDQEIQGEAVRRSYSICAGVGEELRVAVKRVPEGRFSTWANAELKAGDTLRTMPPNGRFFTELDAGQSKHYVAFAAGSGITPILSHIKTVLATEPQSRFTLLYTNKDQASVIFKSSSTTSRTASSTGCASSISSPASRWTPRCTRAGWMPTRWMPSVASLLGGAAIDEVFACGPEPMIHAVRERMEAAGVAEANIHFELFTSPTAKPAADAGAAPLRSRCGMPVTKKCLSSLTGPPTNWTTTAAKASSTLVLMPVSTCPTAVAVVSVAPAGRWSRKGPEKMEVNYALEPGEVEQGFVLTCQTKPKPGSARFVVDFDQQ